LELGEQLYVLVVRLDAVLAQDALLGVLLIGIRYVNW